MFSFGTKPTLLKEVPLTESTWSACSFSQPGAFNCVWTIAPIIPTLAFRLCRLFPSQRTTLAVLGKLKSTKESTPSPPKPTSARVSWEASSHDRHPYFGSLRRGGEGRKGDRRNKGATFPDAFSEEWKQWVPISPFSKLRKEVFETRGQHLSAKEEESGAKSPPRFRRGEMTTPLPDFFLSVFFF